MQSVQIGKIVFLQPLLISDSMTSLSWTISDSLSRKISSHKYERAKFLTFCSKLKVIIIFCRLDWLCSLQSGGHTNSPHLQSRTPPHGKLSLLVYGVHVCQNAAYGCTSQSDANQITRYDIRTDEVVQRCSSSTQIYVINIVHLFFGHTISVIIIHAKCKDDAHTHVLLHISYTF